VHNQFLDFFRRNPEVQCSAHVQSQLGSAPQRHQRGHCEERAQLDGQARTTPDRAEQLFVEKGGEAFVEVSKELIAVLCGFFAKQLRAHFHSFLC
jgi:hypothetical protein